MSSFTASQNFQQANEQDQLTLVEQTHRLSVIRGPSHPPLTNLTFGELTRRQSQKHAERVAVISQHQNDVITYSQLHKRSDDLAKGMLAMGIKRQDRVAVLLGNRSEYVYIGAVITLLNYAYSHTEILSALSTTSKSHHLDWDSLEKTLSDTDILNLQFTSGSTGAPKAAALTHHGMMNCARYIGMNMDIRREDKVVIPVPLFHAFGFIIGLCTNLVQGAATVLPSEYFDAALTLRAVEKYHCTGLYGVTTMFIDQLSHPDFSRTQRSSLRFGLMAGSAMPEELLMRVTTRFPIPNIYTNWGMTELSSIATMTSASDPISKKQKTAGKLLPNLTAKIVAPNTGTVLPWGTRGEIVVSGFSVMHSYFEDVDRTVSTIRHHAEDSELDISDNARPRRWMHTGDEGYIDEDGYLVVTGRIKDLIIRGGENIAPLEIEARLFEHPAIKQACVFGIPNERYGEVVAAFLELEDGMTRPSNEEIREWVRGTLSRFKVPVRTWWLGDVKSGCPLEWPKTANGKVRKKDIREIGEKLAQEGAIREEPRLRERL
ncbi:Acyl-ligase sidI [Hyphodiscus hymeniophilus]|uniref:Acyl-ligase sidI n=1 Tax=Hyphodiscus hymeniophilus TaxID=353542 RepID=A0A9P6VJQ2_9HELO|nr:Acyl-ligase sidI [Hyphodiscus hymeniophilus]